MDLAALRDRHLQRMQTSKIGLLAIGALIALPLFWSGLSELLRKPVSSPCASFETADACQARRHIDELFQAPSRMKVALMWFMGTALLGGTLVVIRSLRLNADAVGELLAHPERIGWVFGIEQSVNGIPTARPVMLRGLDGSYARLAAGPQAEVMATLAKANPGIILGYGSQQAERFAAAAAAYPAR